MSLSRLSRPAVEQVWMLRLAHTYKPAAKQLQVPSGQGFFRYERDVSRDKRYSNPQKPGQDKAPWDWERIRSSYWKKPTLVFDPQGVTHQRLEIMEKLQDEMVSAAKQRGTRQ